MDYSDSCYKPYILKSKVFKEYNHQCKGPTLLSIKSRWLEISTSKNLHKVCQKLYNNEEKLIRLCENDREDTFLLATKFNLNSLYTKTSIYDTRAELFAADILSHKIPITKKRHVNTADNNSAINNDKKYENNWRRSLRRSLPYIKTS